MVAVKFVQTSSKQIERHVSLCPAIAPGLRIALTFPPLMYAWLMQTTHKAMFDPYIDQLKRLYPVQLVCTLNYRTQEWFNVSALMSSRIFFAATDTVGLDMKFVNRAESKGFRFVIRLDGTGARDVTKETKS